MALPATLLRPRLSALNYIRWRIPTSSASLGHRQLARRWHMKAAAPDAKQIEFHFKLRDGSRHTVSAPEGCSVLEAAHANGIPLEGACEASLACSTCHIILPEDLFNAVPEATETEEDLLDLAPELSHTSRLGCQIVVDEHLKGKEIKLPQASINFYVDGHVPTPH
mmetsp:Transcript_139293/g.277772  ORF Transcript_139293/g.277772 Transcript_139293/m.277772 type:complete len:166 (-) Transcript_139293:139-636(-)|eukprot:CAMPEP_0172685870 /NCGR_PEP_ID=MMETSP1074-20121228/20544_1 /TAXON_ID=2916 /ORGANISM="Ceratium fusus, Strain PA161109" /LENGTH=165 /DNA_ID=CAMNT_0013505091 /DNA_START=53 /DNA_END=550 /DNA_ORIENTATION=-